MVLLSGVVSFSLEPIVRRKKCLAAWGFQAFHKASTEENKFHLSFLHFFCAAPTFLPSLSGEMKSRKELIYSKNSLFFLKSVFPAFRTAINTFLSSTTVINKGSQRRQGKKAFPPLRLGEKRMCKSNCRPRDKTGNAWWLILALFLRKNGGGIFLPI